MMYALGCAIAITFFWIGWIARGAVYSGSKSDAETERVGRRDGEGGPAQTDDKVQDPPDSEVVIENVPVEKKTRVSRRKTKEVK